MAHYRNITLAAAFCLALAGGTPAFCAESSRAAAVTTEQVLPILFRRCVVCHGLRRKEGDLDLRARESLLRGGRSGPAIVPGRPDESRALERIRAAKCPPPEKVVEVSVKPVPTSEADLLAQWIGQGAPEAEARPGAGGPDPPIPESGGKFWAFQPPRSVAPPQAAHAGQVQNPLDAFLLRKLEEKGLRFSPEAARPVLLRRVYLDLTGLLPAPDEVEAFVSDPDPEAYQKVVDRLLASPRHGERWARHWLDVAGYADSDGKREQDLPRASAWRYRDYVIRSLNADKPYDRFLLEQLAGDELQDYQQAPEITDEIYDNLVATGFLRMAPDPTWANITNFVPDRLEVIADEIDVLGSGLLGLTIKCARCHDHKFDPLTQSDYYRLAAVLKGAFDEHDWLRSGWNPPISTGVRADRELPHVTTRERREWEAKLRALDEEIRTLRKQRGDPKEIEKRVREIEARRPPEPTIRALWDRGEPSPTWLLLRGDDLSPGRQVEPGVPAVLCGGRTPFRVEPPWPGVRPTGRRLALARWLTGPDHPLTARVAVNRLWKHHFGAGIVKTLGNFGRAGSPPTHPELLDWLAVEFVRRGWSMKAMHRLMVTSAAYRQASTVTPALAEADPGNLLWSRMPLERMEAEVLHDNLVLVAGRLDERRFGPPDPVESRPDGLVTPSERAGGRRRMIYVRQERKRLPTVLENFDLPQMNPNCLARPRSTVALQALYLLNDGMVEKLAGDFAARVRSETGGAAADRIRRAYLIAFGRAPSTEEVALGEEALARLEAGWARFPAGGKPAEGEAAVRALASYCHTLLNSAEFLYRD